MAKGGAAKLALHHKPFPTALVTDIYGVTMSFHNHINILEFAGATEGANLTALAESGELTEAKLCAEIARDEARPWSPYKSGVNPMEHSSRSLPPAGKWIIENHELFGRVEARHGEILAYLLRHPKWGANLRWLALYRHPEVWSVIEDEEQRIELIRLAVNKEDFLSHRFRWVKAVKALGAPEDTWATWLREQYDGGGDIIVACLSDQFNANWELWHEFETTEAFLRLAESAEYYCAGALLRHRIEIEYAVGRLLAGMNIPMTGSLHDHNSGEYERAGRIALQRVMDDAIRRCANEGHPHAIPDFGKLPMQRQVCALLNIREDLTKENAALVACVLLRQPDRHDAALLLEKVRASMLRGNALEIYHAMRKVIESEVPSHWTLEALDAFIEDAGWRFGTIEERHNDRRGTMELQVTCRLPDGRRLVVKSSPHGPHCRVGGQVLFYGRLYPHRSPVFQNEHLVIDVGNCYPLEKMQLWFS